ncbi:hypothetical protein [Terrimonas alba]|uniref:hypothetical protein n=1 Tax=Terrimonas alba TaxID=3349636 RepID=UPI0035F233D1
MKYSILSLLLFIYFETYSQELPVNSQTGLVSIKDSIAVKNKSLQEIKNVLSKWAYTLIDEANLNVVYKLDNSKQTEKISINLPLWSVLTQDKGGNKYVTNGTLTYSRTKTKGLVPTATFGAVKFSFSYTVTAKNLIYEFSNLEYSHDMVHYGKFEGEKPPSNNYNSSLLFKMNKKEWVAVKGEYFENLKILATNLKEYAGSLLINNQASTNQSPINYESYKKITTGMPYDDVVKLLADEGKELSNSSSQVNGKTIILQTIIWYDLDKSKSISVSFTDSKVNSKSQTNL